MITWNLIKINIIMIIKKTNNNDDNNINVTDKKIELQKINNEWEEKCLFYLY